MDKNTRIVVFGVMILLFSGASFIFLDTTITGKSVIKFTPEEKYSVCYDINTGSKVEIKINERNEECNKQYTADHYCKVLAKKPDGTGLGQEAIAKNDFKTIKHNKLNEVNTLPQGQNCKKCKNKNNCEDKCLEYFTEITCEISDIKTGSQLSPRNREILAREEFENKNIKGEQTQTSYDIEKELTDLRNEQNRLQAQVTSLNEEVQQSRNDLRRYEIEERRSEDELKRNRLELARIEKEIKTKESERRKIGTEINRFKNDVSKYSGELKAINARKEGFEKKITSLQDQYNANLAIMRTKESQKTRLNPNSVEYKSLGKEINSLKSKNSALNSQIIKTKNELNPILIRSSNTQIKLRTAEAGKLNREEALKTQTDEQAKQDKTKKELDVRENYRLNSEFKDKKNQEKQKLPKKENELKSLNKILDKLNIKIDNLQIKLEEKKKEEAKDKNFLIFKVNKAGKVIEGPFEFKEGRLSLLPIGTSKSETEDYLVFGYNTGEEKIDKIYRINDKGELEEILLDKVEDSSQTEEKKEQKLEDEPPIRIAVDENIGGKFCACKSSVIHVIGEVRDNTDYFYKDAIIGGFAETENIKSGQDYITSYYKEDGDNFNIQVGKISIKEQTEFVGWSPAENLHRIGLEAKYNKLGTGKDAVSGKVVRTIKGSKTLSFIPKDKRCFQNIDCLSKCSDVESNKLKIGIKEVTNSEATIKNFKSTTTQNTDWKLLDYKCIEKGEGNSVTI